MLGPTFLRTAFLSSVCLLIAAHDAGAAPLSRPEDTWQRNTLRAIADREYDVSVRGGALQAPNRAQGMRAHFVNDGIAVAPRVDGEPAWRWSWRTLAIGRGHDMQRIAARAAVARGARVEYASAGLVEWYENSARGIEQGFSLASRPEGHGALRIDGAIPRGFTATVDRDERGVVFTDARGVQVLRYANLRARDATRHDVPTRIALDGD